jgi:hypothetical protein
MATGYGYYDCVVCGAKEAMLESAETDQPSRTSRCSECGYSEEHCQDSTMIGFVRGNDEDLNPAMFRKVAELMDEELSKARANQEPDKNAPSPNTDGVEDVVWFANDFPSPEKWEACKKYIANLKAEELLQQAGNVLDALHSEDMASEWGLGDYKARSRLEDILDELVSRTGRQAIKTHCAEMLKKHKRENDLYDKRDFDSLLKEGFIDTKRCGGFGAGR